jgi:hypothetical protein
MRAEHPYPFPLSERLAGAYHWLLGLPGSARGAGRRFFGTFHAQSDYQGFYVPIDAASLPAASTIIRKVYGAAHVDDVYTAEAWNEGGASVAERHDLIELPRLSQAVRS